MNLALKSMLDELCRGFEPRHIFPDPVEVVHEYERPEDKEVVALIASCLAYGNVRQILKSVRHAVGLLGLEPSRAIRKLTPNDALEATRGFRHRFNGATDLARLFLGIRRVLEREGSLETFFVKGAGARDENPGPAIERFSVGFIGQSAPEIDRYEAKHDIRSRFEFFFPRPSRGSACKRINLFLRWMIRPADGVDFGLWRGIPASKLLIPLDTHVHRIARYVGLSRRSSADWKAAVEITNRLREFDSADPVRYDFALSRLGILGLCRASTSPRQCPECSLRAACVRAPSFL